MDNNNEGIVISLSDLFGIFLHRLWILILVPIVVIAAMYSLITYTFVPQYESTATLYILKQNDENTGYTYTQSDFSLALNVVNDCTYFLKSHSVLGEVINELELDAEEQVLAESITTHNPSDTRILEVTVVADSPKEAKEIVDEVCEIGADKIVKTMGFNQVSVYEKGTIEDDPCNITGLTTYALAGIASAVFVYAIFLVIFIMDDKIKGEEDVTKFLGLSVLGEIPNTEDTKKGRGKYYKSAYVHQDDKKSK